jgi:thioesterase domain-containing protein/acyl carrier protein
VGGDTTLWSDIHSLRAWLAPGSAIQSIYAATEAPMLQWFVDDSCRGDDARVPIGYPISGNRLAIIGDDGRNSPPGEVGELVVASPYIALGRWALGCLTRERSATREAGGSRQFRTGDLVRQRPDGLLERVGRKDRQVKIRGTRVDLDGVECVLRAHPLVRDAAALARTSRVDGTRTLVAYVSARDASPVALVEQLRESMYSVPPPMRPARFYAVPEIPRLPSSKLDVRSLIALDDANVRSELAEMADDAELAAGDGDHIARTVARVWTEVLLQPVGGPEDDFFEAGGDSLQAMTFVLELERALGRELSPTLLHAAPGFGQLCEILREHRGEVPREDRTRDDVSLVPLKAGEGLPPLFFIHGIGGNVVEILPTARRMAYPGPVIGIRARGLMRGEAPHSSVEAMAADYLAAIKTRQPHGPYYVCGYSFGGLVAFEIARRLSESGEEVGLVGLFDTLMSPLRWRARAWLSIVGQRMVRLAGALRSAPIRVIRVTANSLIASTRYRPGFYRGRLTLFTPIGRERDLPSLEAIWRKYACALSIVEVAGDHSTMLSAVNAASTAMHLTACLPATAPSQS